MNRFIAVLLAISLVTILLMQDVYATETETTTEDTTTDNTETTVDTSVSEDGYTMVRGEHSLHITYYNNNGEIREENNTSNFVPKYSAYVGVFGYNTDKKITYLYVYNLLSMDGKKIDEISPSVVFIDRKGNVKLEDFIITMEGLSTFIELGEFTDEDRDKLEDDFVSGNLDDYDIEDTYDKGYDNIGGWGNESGGVVYDLEVPKSLKLKFNVDTCTDFVTNAFNELQGPNYTFVWEQSEEFQTESYYDKVMFQVYTKYFWEWRESAILGELLWHDENSEKYYYSDNCYNKRHSYSWRMTETDYTKMKSMMNHWTLSATGNHSYNYRWRTFDFLVRNAYYDEETRTQHYSNYVGIKCKSDGTYTLYELDGESTDDNKKDDGTITDSDEDTVNDSIIDSDDYAGDEEIISNDTDADLWGNIKGLFNTLKNYPNFFNKIFGFLPSWVGDYIGWSILVVVAIGTIRFVFK